MAKNSPAEGDDNIENVDATHERSSHARKDLIKILESFSENSDVITPDGLITREDAYDGRWQAEEVFPLKVRKRFRTFNGENIIL